MDNKENSSLSDALNALVTAKRALAEEDPGSAKKFAALACELDPACQDAWLVLAAVSSPQESIACLNRVLDLDPDNTRARKGMRWAVKRLKQEQQAEKARQQEKAAEASGQPKPAEPRRKRRWGFSLFFFLLLTGLVLMVWVGLPALQALANVEQQPRPKNVLLKPTLTPTITPTPTMTPTPTPAPTQTPTPVPAADTAYASYFYHSWDIPEEVAGTNNFWIEVDVSSQMLYAYRGDEIVSAFLVSTGTSLNPTVTGAFKIYSKHPTYTMIGPGYNLPDVPYTLFFYKGYSIHGTYWHNNFGTPMSHGCVNMNTNDAAWIYEQAGIGTYVFVHY